MLKSPMTKVVCRIVLNHCRKKTSLQEMSSEYFAFVAHVNNDTLMPVKPYKNNNNCGPYQFVLYLLPA